MKNGCICVSVPHHVTAFFIPRYTGELKTSGSYGVGVIVGPEGKVCLGKGEEPTMDPLREVSNELGMSKCKFTLKDPLPHSVGYASSAVMAIGGSLAIAYKNNIPFDRALEIAHISEIKSKTGLGDVQAIASNPLGEGIVIRIKPGAPHLGLTETIFMPGTVSILGIDLGKMNTRELLSVYDIKEAIEARDFLNKLLDEPTFERFIFLATEFTKKLSLLRRTTGNDNLESIISSTPGIIGYYVKKKVVIIFVERDRVRDAIDYISKNKLKIRILERRTDGIKFREGGC